MDNSSTPEPRIVDGRRHDFFIVDNPVVDQKIEQVEARRRADVGWTYAVLCRLASNETGEVTLRLSYLQKKTGRSKPVLIECLKWLQKLELIAVRKNREAGRQSASTYIILTVSRVKDDDSESEVQGKQDDGSRVNTDYRSTKTVSTKTNDSSNDESAATKVAPMQMGQFGVKELAQRVRAARERGATIHSPTDSEKRDFGRQFAQCSKDGNEVEHLLWALDYQVAKAAGEIEGEPKAWCGYRTALDKVLDGWRPRLVEAKDLDAIKRYQEETRRLMEEAWVGA